MKNIKTIIITAALTFVVICFLAVILPCILGYQICWQTNVQWDFNAIEAWGTWVAALLPIPISLVSAYFAYISHKEKNKNEEYNIANAQYIKKLIEDAGNNTIKKDNSDKKNEIYRYVCLNKLSSTVEIAKAVEIDVTEAFNFLRELMLVDSKISSAGRASEDRMNQVLWYKKS